MIKGALIRARNAAEKVMLDTCVVRRPMAPVTDPDTGKVTSVYDSTIIWSGPCKLQSYTNRALYPVAGQHQNVIQHYELYLPIEAVGVEVRDVAEIVTSLDPDTVGRVYEVVGLSNKSMSTARRLNVKERSG